MRAFRCRVLRAHSGVARRLGFLIFVFSFSQEFKIENFTFEIPSEDRDQPRKRSTKKVWLQLRLRAAYLPEFRALATL